MQVFLDMLLNYLLSFESYFLKGVSARILWAGLFGGIGFTSFEYMKNMLQVENAAASGISVRGTVN